MAYGMSGHLGLSFQGSMGTSFSGSMFFVPLVSESVVEKIHPLVEAGMYGRLAEAPTHEGEHEVGGDIRTEAHPVYLGAFLKAALGRVSSTLQGSAYLHEFLPAAADWDDVAAAPPMTLEIHRDVGSAFLYYDMLGGALTLEIAQGQLLTAELGVVGGRAQRQARSTPAFKPGRPFTWDVVSASYAGQAISDLRKVSVKFDNQLAAHYTLSGGRFPQRVKRGGPQTVKVDGTLLMRDQALFQEFMDQTEKSFVLAFQGPAVASGTNARLTLEMPCLRFVEFAPKLSGPGLLEVGFSAKAIYDTTSAYALRATLVNTQAGY